MRGVSPGTQVNYGFAGPPELVPGMHEDERGIYGPSLAYAFRSSRDGRALETVLTTALDCLMSYSVAVSADGETALSVCFG